MSARPEGGGPAVGFLLGTGRCGSTLVHEVLVRHPEAGFVSNLDEKARLLGLRGRWNGALYRRLPPLATRKGRLRFAPSEAYPLLDREVAPVLSTPFRDLTAEDVTPWLERRLRRFVEARARAQRTPLFLHKFTGWPRAGFLHRVFPEARMIHVLRDGRAVASSWLQMPWWLGYRGPWHWQWGPLPEPYAAEWEASGRSFALLAGLAWKMLVDAYEAARARLPAGSWLEVRYEDYLEDPRLHTRRMLEFLGLDWTPAFERGFRGYVFDRARREAFREDLDPAQLELLESSLAGHLARHGYAGAGAGSGGPRRVR